ncbi:MAG: metallophosphoesterase [Bacillota bacterium]|nr:metallophosphoesterase [Bacillota bacterium]
MLLVLISDTHGKVNAAVQAVRQAGSPDMILHAGDFFHDATRLQREVVVPVIGVRGNCDSFSPGPDEQVLEAAGTRVLMTHGHLYNVKNRLTDLCKRASELGARVVVFGHTHVSAIEVVDGCLLVNPGSLYRSRDPMGRTFAVLRAGEGEPTACIFRLEELGGRD